MYAESSHTPQHDLDESVMTFGLDDSKPMSIFFLQWPISKRLAQLNLTLIPFARCNKQIDCLFDYWFRFLCFVTNLIGAGSLFPFFSFLSFFPLTEPGERFNSISKIQLVHSERCVWATVHNFIIHYNYFCSFHRCVFGMAVAVAAAAAKKVKSVIRIVFSLFDVWIALCHRKIIAANLRTFLFVHKSPQLRRNRLRLM